MDLIFEIITIKNEIKPDYIYRAEAYEIVKGRKIVFGATLCNSLANAEEALEDLKEEL